MIAGILEKGAKPSLWADTVQEQTQAHMLHGNVRPQLRADTAPYRYCAACHCGDGGLALDTPACIDHRNLNRLLYFKGNATTLPFADAATTTSSADRPEMLGERTNDSPLLLPSYR
jgi:hypothetical protein